VIDDRMLEGNRRRNVQGERGERPRASCSSKGKSGNLKGDERGGKESGVSLIP